MTKVKLVLVVALLISLVLVGKNSFVKTAGILTDYAAAKSNALKLKNTLEKSRADITALSTQVEQAREGLVSLSDKTALSQAILDVDGVTLNSITARKLDPSGDSVNIATVTDIASVDSFTGAINSIEYNITADDINAAVVKLEALKLGYESFEVYPGSKIIILRVLFTGGV